MSEQQSIRCSACDQLGQVPTPEHLAGVARLETRQQAATGDHQPSEGRWGPRCRPCEQPWPCRAALQNENARLRERVAALAGALNEAERKTARPVDGWKPDGSHSLRCSICPAVSPPGVPVHLDWCPFAALAGQEQGGAG